MYFSPHFLCSIICVKLAGVCAQVPPLVPAFLILVTQVFLPLSAQRLQNQPAYRRTCALHVNTVHTGTGTIAPKKQALLLTPKKQALLLTPKKFALVCQSSVTGTIPVSDGMAILSALPVLAAVS